MTPIEVIYGQCPPLQLADVEDFLRTGVSEAALQREIDECGADFVLDAQIEEQLRGLGASDDLVAALVRSALRDLYPPTSGPPVDAETGDIWVAGDDREMVYIQPADFQMGTPPDQEADPDEVRHTVRIAAGFWIDRTEVTNQEYQRFILENPEWQPEAARRAGDLVDDSYLSGWTGTDFPGGQGTLPVVNVSWHAARAYAAWAGKRLPSEAEWEYAARASTSEVYWWGDDFDPARANSGDTLRPVGRVLTANPWGVYDTLGNAAEWTSTLYRPYPYDRSDGREQAEASGNRVVRGGSYRSNPRFLRVANRNQLAPDATSDRLGFRCVQ